MLRRFFLITVLLFSCKAIFASPFILRHIEVKNNPGSVALNLFFSGRINYHYFAIQNPNRFIIDLHNTRTFNHLSLPLSRDNHFITGFRYATHRDGTLRMVFVLTPGVSEKVTERPLTNQLLITFNRTSHEASFQRPITSPAIAPVAASTIHPATVLTDEEKTAHPRDVIIVVDPGHGGKDPGATGIDGIHEKNIVLAISKKLQKLIDEEPGYHAMLTRTGDYYITLRERLRIARRDKADMFIAIHADKWKNTTAHGVSVFALSQKGATSEAARWLAARENASELMGGVNLNDKSHLLKSVLIDLSQAATIRASLRIGADIIQSIKPFARLHHPRVEQAAFVVLKSPDIPSLLVETGFLSNPREERRLDTPAYQWKLARALRQGICEYFSQNPPRGTWLSYWKKHPR